MKKSIRNEIDLDGIRDVINNKPNEDIIKMMIFDYDNVDKADYKDSIKAATRRTFNASGSLMAAILYFRWADTAYLDDEITDEEYEVSKNYVNVVCKTLAKTIDTKPLRKYIIDKLIED